MFIEGMIFLQAYFLCTMQKLKEPDYRARVRVINTFYIADIMQLKVIRSCAGVCLQFGIGEGGRGNLY